MPIERLMSNQKMFDKLDLIMNMEDVTVEGHIEENVIGDLVLVPTFVTSDGIKRLQQEFSTCYFSKSSKGFVLY